MAFGNVLSVPRPEVFAQPVWVLSTQMWEGSCSENTNRDRQGISSGTSSFKPSICIIIPVRTEENSILMNKTLKISNLGAITV